MRLYDHLLQLILDLELTREDAIMYGVLFAFIALGILTLLFMSVELIRLSVRKDN